MKLLDSHWRNGMLKFQSYRSNGMTKNKKTHKYTHTLPDIGNNFEKKRSALIDKMKNQGFKRKNV